MLEGSIQFFTLKKKTKFVKYNFLQKLSVEFHKVDT